MWEDKIKKKEDLEDVLQKGGHLTMDTLYKRLKIYFNVNCVSK